MKNNTEYSIITMHLKPAGYLYFKPCNLLKNFFDDSIWLCLSVIQEALCRGSGVRSIDGALRDGCVKIESKNTLSNTVNIFQLYIYIYYFIVR